MQRVRFGKIDFRAENQGNFWPENRAICGRKMQKTSIDIGEFGF